MSKANGWFYGEEPSKGRYRQSKIILGNALFISIPLLEMPMRIKLVRKYYNDVKYDSKERFRSYWHQIEEIFYLNPEKVLEIGI